MELATFLLLLFGSFWVVNQAFNLSTYHRYFWWMLVPLQLLAGGVGWTLWRLNLDNYFLYLVVGSLLFLCRAALVSARQVCELAVVASDDPGVLREFCISAALTWKYFFFSAVTYMTALIFFYLVLLNTHGPYRVPA